MDDAGSSLSGLDAEATASDIELLTRAVLNEKNAPEILDYKADIVAKLESSLSTQETHTEVLEQDVEHELRRMMFSLENKRVRFLLKLYHRTRLQKVERLAAFILQEDEQQARLSESELQYCQDYFVLMGRHLKSMVLNHLPSDFSPLVKSSQLSEGNDLLLRPALDTHVFAKVVEDAGTVQLDEEQVVDMKEGDLFIMRYRPVAQLARDGRAVLI